MLFEELEQSAGLKMSLKKLWNQRCFDMTCMFWGDNITGDDY